MSQYEEIQSDFSGGEVSGRMFMRSDLAVHGKALLEMLNFMPTLQGTSVRAPGSKFIQAVEGSPTTARIIPYIMPNGSRALVCITPKVGATLGNLYILSNINGVTDAPTQSLVYDYIVENGALDAGWQNWTADRIEYRSSDGARLGWTLYDGGGGFTLIMRRGHHVPVGDPYSGYVGGPFTIPETTDNIILAPQFFYNYNNGKDYGIHVEIRVGTTPNASDIALVNVDNLELKGPIYIEKTVVDGSFTAGQVLYIYLYCEAKSGPGGDGDARNEPQFAVDTITVLSKVTTNIGSSTLTAVVPYLESEIGDVHFVQSPYTAVDIVGHGAGKELVMVHPMHPPMRLYLSGSSYVFENIFTDDATQFYDQWHWDLNGYPATCGSFVGRLVLAGSTEGTDLSPNGSNSETVWTTEVGDWGKFSDPDRDEVLPTDSVNFATIYRSGIRWVWGQKALLVGAGEMEYVASADGVFAPADLGVFMQSTHGSNRVQPAAMGSYVVFPSEGGTKVRSMNFASEAEGWVSPDLTLAHPNILLNGIVRMVRMRTPHQMVAILTKGGGLALLHIDTASNVYAWSRYTLSDQVIDIAVLSDATGKDNLFLLVKRNIGGVFKLYMEALATWVENATSATLPVFLESHIVAISSTTTNVITGLDHLNGRYVQVMADGNYIGSLQVASGQVTLANQIDEPINYTQAQVGLPMFCSMKTLPLTGAKGTQTTPQGSPGSKKRFSKLTVRTLGSTRPVVNGERAQDRDPVVLTGYSQRADILYDNSISAFGADPYQLVTITETLPFNVEVVSIFGIVTENKV